MKHSTSDKTVGETPRVNLIVALFATLAAALAGNTFAEQKKKDRSFPGKGMIEKLDLKPDQVAAISKDLGHLNAQAAKELRRHD